MDEARVAELIRAAIQEERRAQIAHLHAKADLLHTKSQDETLSPGVRNHFAISAGVLKAHATALEEFDTTQGDRAH